MNIQCGYGLPLCQNLNRQPQDLSGQFLQLNCRLLVEKINSLKAGSQQSQGVVAQIQLYEKLLRVFQDIQPNETVTLYKTTHISQPRFRVPSKKSSSASSSNQALPMNGNASAISAVPITASPNSSQPVPMDVSAGPSAVMKTNVGNVPKESDSKMEASQTKKRKADDVDINPNASKKSQLPILLGSILILNGNLVQERIDALKVFAAEKQKFLKQFPELK